MLHFASPDAAAVRRLLAAALFASIGAVLGHAWAFSLAALSLLAGAYSLKIESRYPHRHVAHRWVFALAFALHVGMVASCLIGIAAAVRAPAAGWLNALSVALQALLGLASALTAGLMFRLFAHADRSLCLRVLALPARDPAPGD